MGTVIESFRLYFVTCFETMGFLFRKKKKKGKDEVNELSFELMRVHWLMDTIREVFSNE